MRQQNRAAQMGDPDLEMLHETAMEWRKARAWIKWINKPQTRGQCKKVLRGHTSWTTAAHYISSGQVILTGSADRTLKAWSPYTAEMLTDVGGHAQGITVIAVSRDGTLMVTGAENGELVLWDVDVDVDDGVTFPTEKKRFFAHSKRISSITFMSDSSIVSASDDKEVKIIDVEAGEEVSSFIPFRFPVSAVACAPPDKIPLIATAGRNEVKLWRPDTLERRGGLYGHENKVDDVQFAPNGAWIATASWDCTLRVWKQVRPREWVVTSVLKGHFDAVRTVAWSPDSRTLCSGAADRTVRVWTLENEEGGVFDQLAAFNGHGDKVTNVQFHPAGSLLLSSSRDRDVRIWDTRVPFKSVDIATHASSVDVVATSKLIDTVASAGGDAIVKVWDVYTTQLKFSFEPGHASTITALCFSNSGNYLVTGSKDGTIKRWDVEKEGKVCAGKARAHKGGVQTMAAHHNGEFFLTAGAQDSKITVWEADTFIDILSFTGPPDLKVFRANFSLDGKFVISADSSNSMRVWNIEAQKEVLSRRVGAHGELWQTIDFSTDGKYIITIEMYSHDIVLWNASGGLREEGILRGHTSTVIDTSFSSDGRFLCSLGADMALLVWIIKSRTIACNFYFEFKPTVVKTATAWPLIVAGDSSGNVYFQEFIPPASLVEEEGE